MEETKMNEDKQKILNIFDENVELKKAENREKQEKIKKLIKITTKLGEKNDEPSQNKL